MKQRTTTVYRFKPWSRLAGDAQVVGEAIETIREENGTVGPALVVDSARPDGSPLHPYFEWNDGEAAEQYRRTQASHLLRSIVAVRTDGVELKAPTRAFVSIKSADEGDDEAPPATYTSISEAIRVVDYREQLMKDALRDLDAYRMKYQLLSDLSGWGNAVQTARDVLQRALDAFDNTKEKAA